MNQRDFQRYDKFMGAYAQWIRDGKAVKGLYATQPWPEGRPVKPSVTGCEPHQRTISPDPMYPYRVALKRARMRLVRAFSTNPKSTPPRPNSRVLLFDVDPMFEVAHRRIVRMDLDTKRFILVAWIRGKTELRDISVILGMSSRQIRNKKVEIFDSLGVML